MDVIWIVNLKVQLKNLFELMLKKTKKLVKLLKCIEEMKSLAWFDVSGCDLDCLPQGVVRLENLYRLMLTNNKRLMNLPKCIEKMKSLTWLDVGGCDLDCRPQGMRGLKQLSYLVLNSITRDW